MRKIATFLLLSLVCILNLNSQNITKKYTSYNSEEGVVYFILPMDGFRCKELPKGFKFDITYMNTKDSVTYNFTCHTKYATKIDSVAFIGSDKQIGAKAEMLFIEPRKKNWELRTSVQVAYKEMKAMYRKQSPYVLKVFTEDGIFNFEMKEKDWKKHSEIVSKIFDVADYNKK